MTLKPASQYDFIIHRYVSTIAPSTFATEMIQKVLVSIPTPSYISPCYEKLIALTEDEQTVYSFFIQSHNLYAVKFKTADMGQNAATPVLVGSSKYWHRELFLNGNNDVNPLV